jgi:hypothetical protein
MTINLFHEELAAMPICPFTRPAFLAAVAAELAKVPRGQVGPDVAHRVALSLRRRYLGPAPLDAA